MRVCTLLSNWASNDADDAGEEDQDLQVEVGVETSGDEHEWSGGTLNVSR